MNDTPDDVLRLIFQTYVHDLKRSPAGLLTVNRRWHVILLSTRDLWTRLTIKIDSFDIIPYITELVPEKVDGRIGIMEHAGPKGRCPLESYLRRSCSLDGLIRLPLDIRVIWHPHQNYISPDGNVRPSAHPNHYGRQDPRYFVDLDRRICSVEMELLVLALAGIYVKPKSVVQSEAEGEGENDAIARKKLHIERLNEAFSSITAMKTEEDSGLSSKQPIIDLSTNEELRWRSVEFDLLRVAGGQDIYISLDNLDILERYNLPSLRSLTLKGVYLSMMGIHIPSLQYLEIRQSIPGITSNLEKLEVLKLGDGGLRANRQFFARMWILNLHTVEIFEPIEIGLFYWRGIMEKLESKFTQSHPLLSLTLCPTAIECIVDLLISYPLFYVRTLHLSSQYLSSSVTGGEISSQFIMDAREMLQEMDQRSTSVHALDSHIQRILDLSEINSTN